MTRFLCVGDLHLGAGGDYGRVPGERLSEQEDVWARALEIGRDHGCDVVLFAGDAFHKARPTPDEMLAFQRPLAVHNAAVGSSPVVAIVGNHDVASVSAGTGLEVFAEAGMLTLAREPVVLTVGGINVACLPWTPVSRLVAANDGGDRDSVNDAAARMLVSVARGLRAQVDGPCVLMLHFSVSGTATPDGADVGLFREPVLNTGELEQLGFDAIVAGHIHKQQRFPGGFYTGSPMPLNFGEAKCDHGVWILDVVSRSTVALAGKRPDPPAFVPLPSRPFVTLDYNGDGQLAGGRALTDLAEDAIVKVRVTATAEEARRLDVAALKRHLVAAGAHKVWSVQVDVEREARARVAGVDESLDELDALNLYLDAVGINGTRGARLRTLTQRYIEEARS